MENFNREEYTLERIDVFNGSYYIGEGTGKFQLIRETDETIELLDNTDRDMFVLNKNYVFSCHYVRKK